MLLFCCIQNVGASANYLFRQVVKNDKMELKYEICTIHYFMVNKETNNGLSIQG